MAYGGEDAQYNKKVVVPAVKTSSTTIKKKFVDAKDTRTVTSKALSTFTQTQNQEAQARLASTGFTQYEQNPKFIYPGTRDTVRARNTVGGTTINRGYVRRLTEFYARQSSGSDTPSVLSNLKCNFQFNPDSITRAIQSDTSMQFFFNQDPAQLTQPVPGKAGYAFDLLFNREAEVNSGKYLMGGKLLKGNRAAVGTDNSSFEQVTSRFLQDDAKYDPSWVTEIGVLADIMVLDDILGVGLAKDVVKAITNNALSLAAEEQEKVDPNDATSTVKETVYDSTRMNNFTSNLGNKAFLVPQPIRVVFSDWMMIEGFVTSSQVTFNKFTRGFIPTQCSVAVQMQALYIGFVQQKTFLTDMPVLPKSEIDGTDGIPDPPAAGTQERIIYDQTTAGLTNFLDKCNWDQGKSDSHFLLQDIFAKTAQSNKFNFYTGISNEGMAFWKSVGDTATNAGGIDFTFSGKMSFWWAEHVSNASNTRDTTVKNATGSGLTYALGPPETTSAWTRFGTKENPFVMSINNHPCKFLVSIIGAIGETRAMLVLGKFSQYLYESGEDAMWEWELAQPIAQLPFKQDRFYGEIELTVQCTRGGVVVDVPQKIVHKFSGVEASGKRGIAIGNNPMLGGVPFTVVAS